MHEYRHWLLLVWQNEQGSRRKITPSAAADVVWHEHLTYSKSYVSLGERLIGKYIHHNPDDPHNHKPRVMQVRAENTRKLDQVMKSRFIAEAFEPITSDFGCDTD